MPVPATSVLKIQSRHTALSISILHAGHDCPIAPSNMSRRRATDESTVVADADETLPGPRKDSTQTIGKQRSAPERVGRFLRNRPVSSLLLIILFFSVALATYSVGRVVGQTVLHFLFPSSFSSTSLPQKTHHTNSSIGFRGHNSHSEDEVTTGKTRSRKRSRKKSLSNTGSSSSGRPCYRKFEPGKLGWSKTLCVTDEYYFDISVGSTPIGRFKIGVFGDVVPKSAANFRALVTCTGVFSDESLCFRGDAFHRVVSNFVIQGGSKATGRSIYGPTFREEQSKDRHSFLSHSEKGVVSWAEYPIGSQFYILVRDDAQYLDKNHVVFGMITDGMDVVTKIHDAPRKGEEPHSRVKITACGDAHKRR